jgi:hypothetical protein
MVKDEDYDLVPHSELRKIQGEISELRGGSSKAPSSNLQESMGDLSNSLKSMISIFSEAKNELRIEDQEKELLSSKINPILQKLDSLLEQNEKIAEAILSIAEMIQKVEGKVDSISVSSKESSVDLLKTAGLRAPPQSENSFNSQSGAFNRQQPPQGFDRMRGASFNPMSSMQGNQQQQPPQPFPSSQGFQSPIQSNQSQSNQQEPFNEDLFSSSSDLKAPPQGFPNSPPMQQEFQQPKGMNMPPPPPPTNKNKSFFSK